MRSTGRWLTFLITAACVAGPACQAHDLIVPPWRGMQGTTLQEWRFDTNANPAAPEMIVNPFGGASAAITVGPYGSGWFQQLPGMGTQTGYWDMGAAGTITFTVSNQQGSGSSTCKWLSAQVAYFQDITQAPTVNVAGAALRASRNAVTIEHVPTGGYWLLDQSTWRMEPNPASESVTVTSSVKWGAVVDQVVIDTICMESLSSAAEAKLRPDGAVLEIHGPGPIVTRSFGSYFYMEDPDRVAGIRVNCGVGNSAAEGTAPTVIGTIRTIEGERVLDEAAVYVGGPAPIPRPLAMTTRSPYVGLSPQGLLIMLCGRASVTPGGGFTVHDGSTSPPVRVELYGAPAPADGRLVVLTGSLGADAAGPVLRVNATDQIRVVQ